MKNIGSKIALVCATTAIGVTMFAGVALAAPVLPAGTTSGPHNSRGTCTSCHSYAAAPAAAPAPTAAAPAPAPAAGSAAPAAPAADASGVWVYLPAGTTLSVGAPPAAPVPAPAATAVDAQGRVGGNGNGDD